MAAPGEGQPQAPLVDFEADSEDLAWAGDAEAAAAAQQQQQQHEQPGAAAARGGGEAPASPPPPPPPSGPPVLPPHLASRLGPRPREESEHEDMDDDPAPAFGARRGSEPARSADGWVVFAVGLHPEAQEDDAFDFFCAAGPVKNLSLGLGRETGLVAGYALVEYGDEGSARRAVAELDGREFLGEGVRVDFAFVKPPGDERGGGGGGGRGRRRRRR